MTPIPVSGKPHAAGPQSPISHRRRPFHRGIPTLASLALLVPLFAFALTRGSAVAATPALISQDRPALASSLQVSGTPANAVDDGDSTTRWASAATDTQWIQLDLGDTASISKVVLNWETAYAKGFQLQTSPDQTTWTTIYSTTTGTGGVQTLNVTGSGRYLRMNGTARGTSYGYSLWEFQVYGTLPAPTGSYVYANPPVTGSPSQANPPNAYFHEFQANCSVTRDLPDDPIVKMGMPGMSHMHTFMGNTTTDANSTLTSLQAPSAGTSCKAPGDKSGYWMPTLYNGNTAIEPVGPQVIYYKSGILDYPSVRPFPPGLRYVVGSPSNTSAQFAAQSYEGFECGNSYYNYDIPASCPAGTQLNVRFQSPSCWDGKYLDTPNHQDHMAYPVNGRCTVNHPIALPMIEFKMAWPVSGDLSQVHFSSGRGYSFHYDFFNAWDAPTLAALITHCINGGLQCDARGYDETQPSKGAALNDQYQLP